VIYFVLKGSPQDALASGRAMMDHLADKSLAVTLAVSLGQIRTLIEHPASMTHAAIPVAEQVKAGIDPGGIRLSIGLEAAADIIADLEDALTKARPDVHNISVAREVALAATASSTASKT